MNSIAFVTCNYKRPEILQIYCEGVDRLRSQTNVKIISIIIGDENDITPQYDCIHKVYSNDFLTTRFNVGCGIAKEYNPDYVMIMGSDDIFSIEILNHMTEHDGVDFMAIRDIYLFNLDKDTKSELVYLKTNMIGCCRMLSNTLLNSVGWVVCARERRWGIDQIILQRINPYIKSEYIFTARDIGGICVDIKNESSMNKFSKWKGLEKCDPNILFNFISQAEKDLINNIINNLNP